MRLEEFNPASPYAHLEDIAKKAFDGSKDSDLSEWFSFEQMVYSLKNGGGCVFRMCK